MKLASGRILRSTNILFCEDKFHNLESDGNNNEKDFVFFESQDYTG